MNNASFCQRTARLWSKCRLAILLALGLLLASTKNIAAADAPAKPNIVFILADDLGWKDVGYHGSEIKTPNIDKLAASGARLEQFYVLPLCTPTRACLLTGRYPMRQGLQTVVIFPWAQYGLPLEERTLPQALKGSGYETNIVGKWHLGHSDKQFLPLQRGFDHHYGLYNGAMTYYAHECDGGLDWHRDGKPVREKGYSTELLGAEAVRIISTHDPKQPLFLYVAFNAPHLPLQVPEEYLAKYPGIKNENRRHFAAMVDCEDQQIGRIIAALEERRLRENTIVIFCSDNGGLAKAGANNGELRGGKGTLYEGGIRVPCCVSWPGKIRPNTTVNAPIHVADWYPTLLNRAGANLDQPLKIDGIDIWPALTDDKPLPRRELLLNVTPGSGAVLIDGWKLVLNGNHVTEDLEVLGPKKERAKAPHAPQSDRVELFNLGAASDESHDASAEEPDKVRTMRAALDTYAREAATPKAQPEPAGFKAPAVWGD